jgi:hypothetical protein
MAVQRTLTCRPAKIALAACLLAGAFPVAIGAQQVKTLPATDAGDAVTKLLWAGANPTAPIDAQGVVTAIREFIGAQLSTFPVAISWSGVSPTVVAGQPTGPHVVSFGPTFADRPQTLGRRNSTISMTTQYVRWQSIDGLSLANGDISYNQQLPQSANSSPSSWEGWRAQMTMESWTVVLAASMGLTSHIDVGVLVPFTEVNVSGHSDQMSSPNTATTPPTVNKSTNVSGRSRGIGDISLRMKDNFYRTNDFETALGVDVHLPTGDAAKLLGTGQTSLKVSIIAAMKNHRIAPHVNVGYLKAGGGITVTQPQEAPGKVNPIRYGPIPDTYLAPNNYETLTADFDVQQSDEIDYTFGFDASLLSRDESRRVRTTLAVDILGRLVRNSGHLVDVPFVSPPGGVPGGLPKPGGNSVSETFLTPGLANLTLAAVGGKVQLTESVLLTANVLLPLSKEGLRPGVTPVIGVEIVFR